MELFLISFVIIGLALLGMGIGVLFGRGSLKGSCGGLNTIGGLDTECPVCSGNCEKDDGSQLNANNQEVSCGQNH